MIRDEIQIQRNPQPPEKQKWAFRAVFDETRNLQNLRQR